MVPCHNYKSQEACEHGGVLKKAARAICKWNIPADSERVKWKNSQTIPIESSTDVQDEINKHLAANISPDKTVRLVQHNPSKSSTDEATVAKPLRPGAAVLLSNTQPGKDDSVGKAVNWENDNVDAWTGTDQEADLKNPPVQWFISSIDSGIVTARNETQKMLQVRLVSTRTHVWVR